ncbi:hypothetical protein RHSIM_RhsimUnG0016300 [Rhododendron simsii]|uniref:Uncharacterized protein n=1 Tax=Rhododendron simsii TaxID=118357 RepID=A0A834FXW7_RHOSS|nr:hypothetical protein RHSIM_RhsimUnG0016300 [Rhododendron simsii]
MEIEKESICEPLNDEIAKLKKLVESQDKQIVMLKDVMNKGPLTMMHELKNQKQSLQNDLIEKVESLEKEKKQLELDKLKIVLDKQQAKQQNINRELEIQIEEFKVHAVTQGYVDEIECAVHQVMQNATLEKIRRLEREKEQLELEFLDIRVHEER